MWPYGNNSQNMKHHRKLLGANGMGPSNGRPSRTICGMRFNPKTSGIFLLTLLLILNILQLNIYMFVVNTSLSTKHDTKEWVVGGRDTGWSFQGNRFKRDTRRLLNANYNGSTRDELKYITNITSGLTENFAEYIEGKIPNEPKYAFACLLCDDKLLDAASVLVYSLCHTVKTKYTVLILTLPNVTANARTQLQQLGATTVDITALKYPFKMTKARQEQNKPCRYSKLQLWSMTEYKKIIYMDADMLAVQNIDHLFEQYDEFSAVPDTYPGVFNTGLFVLEPSNKTYQALMDTYMTTDSYNVGDQGYLNWFFGPTWRANSSRHIPMEYNTLIKYKMSVFWNHMKDNIKVVHFTSETKPWNMHYVQHESWQTNMDPVIYYQWIKTHRTINRLMNKNKELQSTVDLIEAKCEEEVKVLNNRSNRFPVKDKFTVLLSTFDRFELSMKLIVHYSKSKLVDKIIVIWHDPSSTPPQVLKFMEKSSRVKVIILQQKSDSLNNKFNPLAEVRTKAVLVVDDDVLVDIRDIDYTFNIWKQFPYRIVGNFPRFHRFNGGPNNTYEYHVAEPDVPRSERRYSIILTKFMFIHSEYLFWYTCLLPEAIHAYIDKHMNCEDIAMQMLSTGMTDLPPLAVQVTKTIGDYGTIKGISAKSGHLGSRADCLCHFHGHFGNKEVLRYSTTLISRFQSIPFVKLAMDGSVVTPNSKKTVDSKVSRDKRSVQSKEKTIAEKSGKSLHSSNLLTKKDASLADKPPNVVVNNK